MKRGFPSITQALHKLYKSRRGKMEIILVVALTSVGYRQQKLRRNIEEHETLSSRTRNHLR